MDFAYTRQENDTSLLNRLDAIRDGRDLEVLEPFAKAYLGLFYDIDSNVPAVDRIDLLANPELSAAIKQGFVSLLRQADLPTPEMIATSLLQKEIMATGYIVLAGMSMQQALSPHSISDLPEACLKSAICFHHAISTFHDDSWYEPVLTARPQLAAEALLAMWQVLLDNKQYFLPGLHSVLEKESMLPLFRHCAIALLKTWRHCRHRDLSRLLSLAIHHVEAETLHNTARAALSECTDMSQRNQVYWHATLFLLAPDEHGQDMINFMGQEKIKLLPLLDFVIPLLDSPSAGSFSLSATGYAYLIRCLAQKFTPQIDMHDNLGEITLKVLWLFYQLAGFSNEQAKQALSGLQRVRVLKLYSDIFTAVAAYQTSDDLPDFELFVQRLRDEGRLRMKKNWHDVK